VRQSYECSSWRLEKLENQPIAWFVKIAKAVEKKSVNTKEIGLLKTFV
jgi:hypothetical protein